MPIFSFGNAAMAYTGQNVGAGSYDRVKQGTRQCMYMSVGITTAIVIAIVIFGRPLASMFTGTEEILDLSARMLRILGPGYIAMAFGQVYWGVLRGAGDTMTPMWAAFATTLGLRVPTSYLLVHLLGTPDAIIYSALISWTAGSIYAFIAYAKGGWKNKAIVKAESS
jgi:Na+-driven multidrug efflux pump